MSPQTSSPLVAIARPMPASGWSSWAPEVVEANEPIEAEAATVGLLGGVASLLMWGCASLLAVWYL